MEEAAMVALSFWHGMSWEAKHEKRLIFELNDSPAKGYYEKIFNDNTAPQYIYLPWLFYDDAYAYTSKTSDKATRGAYRSLDLLALAVLGDTYKVLTGVSSNPKRSKKVVEHLKANIDTLRKSSDRSKQNVWKLAFRTLHSIAEKRRRAQAQREKVKGEEISLPNVISRLRFTDPAFKTDVSKKTAIQPR